jgi:hypothetical protein
VIDHEGLGYYGIGLDHTRCAVHRNEFESLGRVTAAGDVELWKDGGPGGSSRLGLSERFFRGEDPDLLLQEGIEFLELKPLPRATHLNCRHKRWGESYRLMFTVAARVALRAPKSTIWNHRHHTEMLGKKHDPDHRMKEHPGHFLFRGKGAPVFIAGDGRVLLPEGEESLWTRHMKGESEDSIVDRVLGWMGGAGAGPESGAGTLQTQLAGEEYSMFEHRHRFAAWAAARAAQRSWKGGANSVLVAALHDHGPRELLAGDAALWPDTAARYDASHRQWCEDMIAGLATKGVEATYGRAAKLVAIYMKAMVVTGPHAESELAKVLHPPIDDILTNALAKCTGFSTDHRRLWRRCKWTKLDLRSYFEIIEAMRAEGLNQPRFWAVERFWRAG